MNAIEPMLDRILVERLPEPEGLIFLTDKAKPKICKVLAVGPGRWVDGVFTKTAVKPGDVVLIPGWGGEHPDYECEDGTFLIQSADVGAILG